MRPNQLPLHLITIIPSLLPSLFIFTNFACADPVPIAIPEAAPVANALPIPIAKPEPFPGALAEAEPDALGTRQILYNNAPFSGAIYIVGANGAQLTPASAAWCPNYAPQGCGNIGVWNWCCPSGNSCAWANSDHSVVGCCPSGTTCSGSIDR
jgi:hypothetical protein